MVENIIEVPENAQKLEQGLYTWKNIGNGFTILDLDYTADPEKRTEEWRIQSQSGMPRSEWEREYGRRWIVYDGKPVYADYDDTLHTVKGTIIAAKRAKLISGWDGGPNDVNLAWVLGLVATDDLAVTWIDEYSIDDGDIPTFVEIVASKLKLEWSKLGGFSIHIADQSVFTKSQVVSGGKAMADVMRQYGMAPIPGEISFAKRRSAVQRMMVTNFKATRDGSMTPKWRVHERCVFLREAMAGGYAYPKANMGVGGQYRPAPMKNKFSHISNAMEYASSRLAVSGMDIPYAGRKLPKMRLVGVG
jgi:hypothetical protein